MSNAVNSTSPSSWSWWSSEPGRWRIAPVQNDAGCSASNAPLGAETEVAWSRNRSLQGWTIVMPILRLKYHLRHSHMATTLYTPTTSNGIQWKCRIQHSGSNYHFFCKQYVPYCSFTKVLHCIVISALLIFCPHVAKLSQYIWGEKTPFFDAVHFYITTNNGHNDKPTERFLPYFMGSIAQVFFFLIICWVLLLNKPPLKL